MKSSPFQAKPRKMSRKEILLNEQLRACGNMIQAYREYVMNHPAEFQPNNTYYRALMEEYKKIQEQIIDEQIRFFVYGEEK